MGPFEREAPGARLVEVLYGDSLRRIALRELGSAEGWVELATLNGLRPPYIVNTEAERGPGLLVAGDLMKVPAPVAYVDAEVSPDEVFGRDLQLAKGRLQVEDGDLALVGGNANLNASLLRRIDVTKRELQYHPTYGNFAPLLKGQRAKGAAVANLAAFYVRSALLDDERVAEVPECTASIEGDTVRVKATVVPVSGRPLNLNTVL